MISLFLIHLKKTSTAYVDVPYTVIAVGEDEAYETLIKDLNIHINDVARTERIISVDMISYRAMKFIGGKRRESKTKL